MSLIEWLAQRAPKEEKFHNPIGWNFLMVWLYSSLGNRGHRARGASELARLLCS